MQQCYSSVWHCAVQDFACSMCACAAGTIPKSEEMYFKKYFCPKLFFSHFSKLDKKLIKISAAKFEFGNIILKDDEPKCFITFFK